MASWASLMRRKLAVGSIRRLRTARHAHLRCTEDERYVAAVPTMTDQQAWRHLVAARSAVLATVAADGSVDLVPIVFHADAPRLYLAVDDVKPKSTPRL